MTGITRAVLRSAVVGAASGRRRLTREAFHQHAAPVVLFMQSARLYSNGNAPSKNPFEIHFHPDDEDKIFKRKPQSSTTSSSALTPQEAEIQDEIHLLHAEMAGIFGEEPEEYDSSSSSSSDEFALKKDQPFESQPAAAKRSSEAGYTSAASSLLDSRRPSRIASRDSIYNPYNDPQVHFEINKPSILVLQGPCSYVQNMAVGPNKPKHELLSEIHIAAAQLGVVVTCRDSNHEGEILDWLLGADAGSTIVLCWSVRLSASPMIIRALELLESHAVAVVVVSPLGVEHGTLPASVRGVLSGMDANAMEIALHAANALAQ